MNWDKDIRFLAKRVDEQLDYINKIINNVGWRCVLYQRKMELIKSATEQRIYFEEKIWSAINEYYKVDMFVIFTDEEFKKYGPWKIHKIYLSKDLIIIESEDRNCCINAPYRNAYGLIKGLEIYK